MAFPVNPDLPTGYVVPGIFGYVSLLGSGPTALNRRVNALMLRTSAGNATANVPIRVNNEEEALAYSGKGSEFMRWFRAYLSQGGGAEVWLTPIVMTGTAQTRLIKIMAAPSSAGVLDAAQTTAQSAGVLSVWIAWYRFDVTVANGDLFATVAANLHAEILKFEDYLPCTSGISSDTVTLTLRHATHAAAVLADLPIVVKWSNTTMELAASPGTITLLNVGDGTGAGHTLLVSTQSLTHDPNGETANNAAAAWITEINAANAYPVYAAQTAPSAVITLFYADDRVVNRPSVTTTDTTQTATAAWGVVSTVSNPSLANAIANIVQTTDTVGAFRLYAVGQLAEATSLGTLSSHIESQGNGKNCKGQVVVFCSTRALATAGAIPTGTTPALTASPRYIEALYPAAPNQEYEYAARVVSRIISQDFLPQNYAGMTLTTDGRVPLGLAHQAVTMSDSDVNAAMVTYYLTPLRANTQNQLTIVSGRTTAKPGASIDVRFVFWGTILTVDYFRDDIRSYFAGVLKGKSIKVYGQPHTTNVVTPDAIKDLAYGRMVLWDALDYFDGAERLREYLQGGINAFLPSRFDLAIPLAEPIPLEQISVYMTQMA